MEPPGDGGGPTRRESSAARLAVYSTARLPPRRAPPSTVQRSALILAGGSGTRFWPASRRDRPKQLLPLDGERSLLARTVERLAPLVPSGNVWISTTEALAGAIRAALPDLAADR